MGLTGLLGPVAASPCLICLIFGKMRKMGTYYSFKPTHSTPTPWPTQITLIKIIKFLSPLDLLFHIELTVAPLEDDDYYDI